MRRADVSVHVDQRRLPCVLEPSLLLTHAQGPTLALRLVAVFEPWLTRSFWQALDNSELLMGRSPRPAGAPLAQAPRAAHSAGAINAEALSRWIQLRERTDESAWVLRWVGDRIAESQLRDMEDLSLFDQFELLQAALEQRAEQHGLGMVAPWRGLDLHRAALDALSLSAVLEGALILCSATQDGEPAMVALARQLGLEVTDTGAGAVFPESLFSAERQFLREALARAGLAPLAQRLPALAAVHVCLDMEPANSGAAVAAKVPAADTDVADVSVLTGMDCDPPAPWQHARLWWYEL
jgi:hypothetical protein